ncbi:MAG: hypothetical protein IPN76_12630 [Saprospiraceae bacterium]|jgi:hypothetical protein|nr:hypothetical protein [Saprospiraceae bacterium]
MIGRWVGNCTVLGNSGMMGMVFTVHFPKNGIFWKAIFALPVSVKTLQHKCCGYFNVLTIVFSIPKGILPTKCAP